MGLYYRHTERKQNALSHSSPLTMSQGGCGSECNLRHFSAPVRRVERGRVSRHPAAQPGKAPPAALMPRRGGRRGVRSIPLAPGPAEPAARAVRAYRQRRRAAGRSLSLLHPGVYTSRIFETGLKRRHIAMTRSIFAAEFTFFYFALPR